MIYTKYVAENGNIRLKDESENCVFLNVKDKDARLLGFSVPDENRESELYKALLAAAEAEACRNGKNKIVYDFTDTEKNIAKACFDSGYRTEETNSVICVKTEELLSSTGVQKSLRMKFPQVEAVSFSDLVSFQREEIKQFLNKFHFPADKETFLRIDPEISAVAFDDNYEVHAVLLASRREDEINVELLFGFSAKKPQYILAVCQKFAESLIEQKLKDDYPRISMLTINENVVPLLKRLLNKEFKLESYARVLHAEKELSGGSIEIEETEGVDSEKTELTSLYQYNINEKYVWAVKKKG